MGIQDDMFDIENKLKGTDLEEAFNRFSVWAGQQEYENDQLEKENAILRKSIKIVSTPKAGK